MSYNYIAGTGSTAGMPGVAGFASPAPNKAGVNAATAAAAAAAVAAAGGGGHHGVQLIPFTPTPQQAQQQHVRPHSLTNGSSDQQQQQQGSDHVIVVRPGFVQLQQQPHGGAVAGSGWRAVGDDLEMDEFGNMYTTGGNAAPGNGGSTFGGGGDGGARRGGGARGKATEAQTWWVFE
jgi:hypothetical protein